MAMPLCDWAACAEALHFEAVYAQGPVPAPASTCWRAPWWRCAAPPQPGPFVFDGELGDPPGLLALW